MDFNILMLGGRRTGKTSVLASMISCFNKITSGDNFKITAKSDTHIRLSNRLIDLNEMFQFNMSDSFLIPESPTAGSDYFEFTVSIAGKNDEYNMRFTDIPGENLYSDPDAVTEEISKNQIIIIAIDTVHLMEEKGRFALSYNRVFDLTSCIKSSTIDRNVGDKLILFVPLKCEKYFLNNQMEEVKTKIKETYSELFGYFGADNIKKYFTVAITPILTVGEVIFDRFGRDENGHILVNKEQGSSEYMRPMLAYYKYASSSSRFNPQFCEQPVLFILTFIAMFAQKHSRNKPASIFLHVFAIPFGILGLPLVALINKIVQDINFQNYVKGLKVYLKRDKDGYEIVQNPLSM